MFSIGLRVEGFGFTVVRYREHWDGQGDCKEWGDAQ